MKGARTAVRIVTACALAGAALLTPVRSARADVVLELAPMSSVGATTNAQVSTVPAGDALVTVANTTRLRLIEPRSLHALAYRLAWTRFVSTSTSTLTNDLTASSAFTPAPAWSINLAVTAAVTSTARTDFIDPTTIVPQASQTGTQPFLALSAGEGVGYEATQRWRISEGVTANRLDYLGENSAQPTSMSLNANLRTDYRLTLSSIWLDARFTDFFVDGVPPMAMGPFAGGHTYMASLMAGWTRELSFAWSFDLSAGPMVAFRAGGPYVVAPAASTSLRYRRQTWFATLTAAQTPTANLFTGTVSVNDVVTVRLALPLTRNEQTVLAGFAGYTYARTPNANGDLEPAYQQWLVGATLNHRFGRMPLYGSVQYTLIDQIGQTTSTGSTPSVVRQTVMLTISGLLTWGAGQAEQFGGAGL